jgi:tRNA-specific 2-thiouridylase
VELAAPEDAIAPGQACVFYKEGRVLGGGWIARAEPASMAAE